MIILLTGTGRTGKTSVVQSLLEKFESRGKDVEFIPSIVRGHMQSYNVFSEGDFYKQPNTLQNEIQDTLFNAYMNNLTRLVKEDTKDKTYILDRSPFDHLSYMEYVANQNGIDNPNIKSYASSAQELILSSDSRTFYFPWPCPWTDSEEHDPFRYFVREKEIFVNSQIINYLTKLDEIKKSNSNKLDGKHYFFSVPNNLSPKVRSDIIYTASQK